MGNVSDYFEAVKRFNNWNPEFLDQNRNGHGIAFIAIFIFGTISVRDENKPYKGNYSILYGQCITLCLTACL